MKNENHLTDAEIQQYAFGETRVDEGIAKHLDQCTHCSARAALYREMAASIAATSELAFDFELVPAVLAKLPAPKPRRRSQIRLIVASVAITGVLVCIFCFYYLYNGLLKGMSLDYAPAIYGVAAVCALLFALLMADLWQQYTRKAQWLDTSGILQQNLRGAV
ncbi:hypothetical protein [Dyadobacter sp. OTU695]|uniref:hypothetical protein n=1 Tax=Dyadobacter sp. OTU695 TaxID=3043860 RepID=UPI00313D7E23